MKYFFHEDAEAEFNHAIDYYENCRRGLGAAFVQAVHRTILRIVQFPEAGSPMSKNTRRCLVNRFPFGIIYQVKLDCLWIIAVADLRRRPGYWLNRE